MKFFRVLTALAFLSLSLTLNATERSQTQASHVKIEITKNESQLFFEPASLDFLKLPENYVAEVNYIQVHFQNKCWSTVAMVARYKDLDGSWINDGAWKMVAGERGY